MVLPVWVLAGAPRALAAKPAHTNFVLHRPPLSSQSSLKASNASLLLVSRTLQEKAMSVW